MRIKRFLKYFPAQRYSYNNQLELLCSKYNCMQVDSLEIPLNFQPSIREGNKAFKVLDL